MFLLPVLRSLVAAPYFLQILVANPAKAKDFGPSNFSLRNVFAESKPSYLCGKLLPRNNPKFLSHLASTYWLGDQDSNLDKVLQRHLTYH